MPQDIKNDFSLNMMVMGILMLTVNHIERRDLRKEPIAWGGEDHIEIAQSFFEKGKLLPQAKTAK